MTGYGEAKAENKKVSLCVQIKSVNGRFFEPKFKIPKVYLSFENEMKNTMAQKFYRGHVEIMIHRADQKDGVDKEILINTNLANSWIKASKKLSKELKLKFSPTMDQVLKIPEVLTFPEYSSFDETEKALLLSALNKAMENCLSERRREGGELLKNLRELLNEIKSFATNVERRKSEIQQILRSQLEKKLSLLAKDFQLDPQRLHQEAIFILDKADVSEEIVRLNAHLDGFEKTLQEKASVGKKLDFLVQELHREVNTIGSKTQAVDIMEAVIQAKAAVEKIREQVQNIE